MLGAVFLLVAVCIYRVFIAIALGGRTDIAGLNNFSPLAAVALCGAIFLPRRFALVVPFAALFISDLILNAHYHVPLLNLGMIPQYLALGLIAALGFAIRGDARAWRVLGSSLVGSLLFYVVTNTGAWLGAPEYARTFSGWLQALTVGLAGFPPSWMFFRNTAVSDLIFTGMFLLAVRFPRGEPRTAVDAAPAAR